MSNKTKGTNAERDLVRRFANTGSWLAVRIAGSGSSQFPAPDILAGNNLRKLAIECKVTKETTKYITIEEMNQILAFANTFGAEAWFAIKFAKSEWRFVNPEDLKQTKGDNFLIDEENIQYKGLSFDELIS